MGGLSEKEVKEFCDLCNWTYEVWVTHRALYDDNADLKTILEGPCGDVLARLYLVSSEYVFLQIAKLHDPSPQGGFTNLSLDHMIKFGRWDEQTLSELKSLHKKLKPLANCIRPARNKFLSHNSLKEILDKKPLGAFRKDDDRRYFETLEKFAEVVYTKVIGGTYVFSDFAKGDAKHLLDVLPRKTRDESNHDKS